MIKPNFIFVSVILWALLALSRAELDVNDATSTTREHIVANYERRREQLKKLVTETKEKVSDHETGRKLLDDEEYALLQKRIGLYEKKLESMAGPMSERDIDKALERDKMREQRRHREL